MNTANITKKRIAEFLKQGKRFDGRKPEDFRKVEITYGVSDKAEGSAKVKVGKTEVIVGIKLSVGEPYPDSADKGNLITSAEILPMSSSRIELGKPLYEAIELGRVVDRGIRESGFIDFKKLCIKEGEKVWNVNVDIYTINDDGNLMDASGIGAIAALMNTQMPKYDEETERVNYDERSGAFPVTDKLPLTISLYKVGDKFLVDPTREEEDASTSRLTLGATEKGISSAQKSNESSVTVDELSEALDLMEKAWKGLHDQIKKQLKR